MNVRPCATAEEMRAAFAPLWHYFGQNPPSDDAVTHFKRVLPIERVHAGFDREKIVSGSADNTIRAWDAASGRCLLTLPGHSDAVLACGWSPGGDRIVSGSHDNTLKVWDATSGRCLLTLPGHYSVRACACRHRVAWWI